MYLRDIGTTLLRRWYLSLVGLLATAGLCFVAITLFPTTYQATATIVLLPPKSTVEVGGNPYLQLANLEQVVDVMVRSLNSQSAVDKVAEISPNGSYEVAPDYTTSGPIFIITAEDQTSQAALSTLKTVTDTVPQILVGLQESLSIEPQSQITSSVLTTDERPEVVRKTQLRVLIVAAAFGLLASALMIALIDSLLLRRTSKLADAAPASRATDLRTDGHPEQRPGSSDSRTAGRPRRLGLNNRSTAGNEPTHDPDKAGSTRRRQ